MAVLVSLCGRFSLRPFWYVAVLDVHRADSTTAADIITTTSTMAVNWTSNGKTIATEGRIFSISSASDVEDHRTRPVSTTITVKHVTSSADRRNLTSFNARAISDGYSLSANLL